MFLTMTRRGRRKRKTSEKRNTWLLTILCPIKTKKMDMIAEVAEVAEVAEEAEVALAVVINLYTPEWELLSLSFNPYLK
jgi:hypothetical protein